VGAGFLLLFFLFLRLDAAVVWDSLSRVGWTGFGLVLLAGLVLTACLSAACIRFSALMRRSIFTQSFFGADFRRQANSGFGGDILPFTRSAHGAWHAGAGAGGIAPARAIAPARWT